jgi:hypothetical protein
MEKKLNIVWQYECTNPKNYYKVILISDDNQERKEGIKCSIVILKIWVGPRSTLINVMWVMIPLSWAS